MKINLRKLTKFGVITISVLCATLIKDVILTSIKPYYMQYDYLSVLINMVVTVLIYVPLFGFLGMYIEKVSKAYVEGSKNIAHSRRAGFYIGFIIAILGLYILFALVIHKLDLWGDLGKLLDQYIELFKKK